MNIDTTTDANAAAIRHITAPDEQHMLFLFLPLKHQGTPPSLERGNEPPQLNAHPMSALHALFAGNAASSDPRPNTGVHFFMFYDLVAGETPAPPPPFPAFQVPPSYKDENGKEILRDLSVVMAIYDADFFPYITAFTNDTTIAAGLDFLLTQLDETGFVDPSDKSSAENILKRHGTHDNPKLFVELLMRYNWADPRIFAATSPGNIIHTEQIVNPNRGKYFMGATFPGLTVAKILDSQSGFPNANQMWPYPAVQIKFDPSGKPEDPS